MRLAPANFNGPSAFSTASPFGKIKGVGCAGTSCNVTAAKGAYSPGRWTPGQVGGTSLRCLSKNSVSGQGDLIAPFRGGHPAVAKCSSSIVANPLAMKGGGAGPGCGCMPGARGGGRRRRRKGRRTRGRRTARRRASRRPSHRRARKYRGGSTKGMGYSNVPLAYGYSLGAPLTSGDSALATPPPQHVYNHCKPGAELIPK